MNKKIESALNEQIKEEFAAAYTYLSMSAYCETQDLPGFASWLKAQAEEEMEHAMKIYGHVIERGGQVKLQAIPEPKAEFGTIVELFEQVLAQEQAVTAMIHQLYDLARAENDYASFSLLTWFADEQVEEEDSVGTLLSKVKRAADSPAALLFLDAEAGKRD